MTIYLNTQTNEYPRHDGDLQKAGWKIGDALPENWVEVSYTEPPTIDSDSTYVQNFPTLIDGKWTITWNVRELTSDEKLIRDTPRIEASNGDN